MHAVLQGRAGLRLLLLLLVMSAQAQTLRPGEAALPGQHDTGGVHAPTQKLERGRVVFVESSCNFCHGVDLTVTAMGAADLLHSPLVGADVDGNVIGAIVKAGLPSLQTAMPSYAEMTPQQIDDLAAYVHYLRQQGHLAELTAKPVTAGDAALGKAYFDGAGGCAKCHTNAAGLTAGDAAKLRSRILMPPGAEQREGVAPDPGAIAHRRLTENISAANLADVTAYLGDLK
jgi:mono/diheme cytochrome c family protein